MFVNPVIHPLEERLVKLPVGLGRNEGSLLGPEIGAAHNDHTDTVANDPVDLFEIFEGDLTLTLKDPIDVVPSDLQADKPLLEVSNPLGMLEPRGRNEGLIAELGASEIGNDGLIRFLV